MSAVKNKQRHAEAKITGSICSPSERWSEQGEGFSGFSLSLQIVTHQMHLLKSLANCHPGCGRANVPMNLLLMSSRHEVKL